MAQINIFEMGSLDGKKPVVKVPWNAQQAKTASPSSAFAGGTRFARVQTDTTIYVKFGPAGTTATTVTDYKIAANTSDDFEVEPGQIMAWTT